MPKLTLTPTNVWNLSLGGVLEHPIAISSALSEFGRTDFPSLEFSFHIINGADHFAAENALAAYHSMENKQRFDYNPRASACTASLTVSYDDYDGEELMWKVHYSVDEFLHRFIAPFLGFCQRRRVIIGDVLALPSKTNAVWLGGSTFAGEFIDSVGHGQVAFDPASLQVAVVRATESYVHGTPEQREHLLMLLRRYNDVLNLPYTYERFDGYWRIVECLGRGAVLSQQHETEYKRVCVIAGAPNGSRNLKSFLGALLVNDITYSDDAITSAFKYRNESTHNYLQKEVIDAPSLPNNFHFVAECADRLIFRAFGLDQALLKPSRHSIIVNRIV